GAYARNNFHLMIQRTVRANLENSIHSAGAQISGAINQTFYSGVDYRSGAHRARLDGDVQSRPGQTIVTNSSRRVAQSHYFGMRCRIIGSDRMVAPTSHNLIVNYNDGANGNLARIARRPGFVKR